MLGFDEKELFLSHDSPETVIFELLADFTGEGIFSVFDVIQVNSSTVYQGGKSYKFQEGFSANWVSIRADKDCLATAEFTYK